MELNKYIDHTLLKPETTKKDIFKICLEAKKYNFASVCVNSSFAKIVHELLEDTGIKTCVVVGFPLGAMSRKAKVYEAKVAVEDGADEIDMVINIGLLLNGKSEEVYEEIKEIKEVCGDRVLKVILETCLLEDLQIIEACQLAEKAGADFVKTSTGFSEEGATLADVRLMRHTAGDRMGVKASGGIRIREDALAMIEAGADRIGASRSVEIVLGE